MRNEDYQRLVEIARLYYEKDLTQAEIAKAVGVSRPVVSRLLAEARLRGIVRIEVRSPLDEDHELLGELMRTFGIRGGLIVPIGTSADAVDRSLMVSQAALYVQRLLPEVRRLGLGWGETVRDVISHLEDQAEQAGSARSVCPVIGSGPSAIQWFQTNELTRILAEKMHADPYYLHAPAFPASEGDRALFTGTVEYRQVCELWRDLDLVLLGLGTYPTVPDDATAARFGDRLKQQKAVGVLATYYFDARGTIIDSPQDYAVRIPLADLRSAKQVVVVTGGTKKAQAVHGGLMTGLITHLVTDEGTARELLRYHQGVN
jgi:deoxyribonucleoside regulator